MDSLSWMGASLNSLQILWICFVTHCRAHRSVDRNCQKTSISNPIRNASNMLSILWINFLKSSGHYSMIREIKNWECQLENLKKNVVTSDCRQCEYNARTICRIRWHSDLLASHFGAGHPSFIRNVVPRYLMTLLPLPNWPWTDAITMNIENTNVKIVFIFTVLILKGSWFFARIDDIYFKI